jgi:hypothetical protein
VATKPTERDRPHLVEPAPTPDVRLAALGADLIRVGEVYLAHARRWAARPSASDEFRAASVSLGRALEAREDGVAIVAAIAQLVRHGESPPKYFGANLHGLSLGLRLWFEQNRHAAGQPRAVDPSDPQKKVDPNKVVALYRALKAEGLNYKVIDQRLKAEVGVGIRWAQRLAGKNDELAR